MNLNDDTNKGHLEIVAAATPHGLAVECLAEYYQFLMSSNIDTNERMPVAEAVWCALYEWDI